MTGVSHVLLVLASWRNRVWWLRNRILCCRVVVDAIAMNVREGGIERGLLWDEVQRNVRQELSVSMRQRYRRMGFRVAGDWSVSLVLR